MKGLIDKIGDEAKDIISTFSPLTYQPITEVNMAKPSLPKICSIENCNRGGKIRRGMCDMHYYREKRAGSFTSLLRNLGVGDTEEERFWSRVALTTDIDKCWEWQGSASSSGYGQVCVNGKNTKAHRAAWLYTYGVMPTNFVLHSCDNRLCVNPNHLREGTNQDNMDDKVARNRQSKGEAIGISKLNEAQVIEIREKYAAGGISHVKLGLLFNTGGNSIYRIVNRKTWKHV